MSPRSRTPVQKTITLPVSMDEEQRKLEVKLRQRRSLLRELMASQYDRQELVRHQLSDEKLSGNPKFVIGQPPLDTDVIVVIGFSISWVKDKDIYLGAYSLTWWDERYPAQASTYVGRVGGDLFAYFTALKAVLRQCKPDESITVIAHSSQFAQFINNGSIKGRRKGITQQFEHETLEAMRARPGRVQGLDLQEGWATHLLKYTSQMAQTARIIRRLEDPDLLCEQQEVPDSMENLQPVSADETLSPLEMLALRLDPYASVQQITVASLQAQNDLAFSVRRQVQSRKSPIKTRDHIPLSKPSPHDLRVMSAPSSIVTSDPCQTTTSTSPACGDMRPGAVPKGGENDIALARPPLAVQNVDVSTDMRLRTPKTTVNEVIMAPHGTSKDMLKRLHDGGDTDSSESKRLKGEHRPTADEHDPDAWKEWAQNIFPM